MIRHQHPKTLTIIFSIEMWERFGFYIMSAVYVLYMEKVLHFSDSEKGTLYGLFLFASYMFPILGGWLGDRLLGPINTIRSGVWCMFWGYIGLALSGPNRVWLFFIGLGLVALGTGIFKVNMSALMAITYRDRPELRDAGFNIYYMGVNLGATIGPLTANLLGYAFNNYHLSFWAAAMGMVISLLIIEKSRRPLEFADQRLQPNHSELIASADMPQNEFRQRLTTLAVLFFIAALFWIPFYQNGMALTLFADRSTQAYPWLRPEIYLMFGAVFILLFTPPLLAFFGHLRKKGKEPATPWKIFFGLTFMGLAMLIMMVASLLGGDSDTPVMSPWWLIATYGVITIAEILISPMGQSYVAQVAPPKIQGMMFGCWFGATALGALSSGLFGKFYSDFDHHQYFFLLALISFLAAILLLVFKKQLNRYAR